MYTMYTIHVPYLQHNFLLVDTVNRIEIFKAMTLSMLGSLTEIMYDIAEDLSTQFLPTSRTNTVEAIPH